MSLGWILFACFLLTVGALCLRVFRFHFPTLWPFNRAERLRAEEIHSLLKTYGGHAFYDGKRNRWQYYSPFDPLPEFLKRMVNVSSKGVGSTTAFPLTDEGEWPKRGQVLEKRHLKRAPRTFLKRRASAKADDPFTVLGVPDDATKDQIDRAFKARLNANQPMALDTYDPELRNLMQRRVATLRAAYREIVKNRSK